jgi:hypothetical protein
MKLRYVAVAFVLTVIVFGVVMWFDPPLCKPGDPSFTIGGTRQFGCFSK